MINKHGLSPIVHAKKIVVFLFSLLATYFMISQAVSATTEWCVSEWDIISAKTFEQKDLDFQRLLENWEKIGEKCSGTGIYEARLASAYLFLGEVNKAREIIKPFERKVFKYSNLIEFVSLHADEAELVTKKRIDTHMFMIWCRNTQIL